MSHQSSPPGRSIRASFAAVCVDARLGLDISQAELARRAGVSRGYVTRLEQGTVNATVDVLDRVADALGLDIRLSTRATLVLGRRGSRDLVHAWCATYVDRRLSALGFVVVREVEVDDARAHGWIDLLAFHPLTGLLLLIEVKTRLDDLGAIERQINWYERRVEATARRFGWQPRRIATWLVALASAEVDAAIRDARPFFERFTPRRAASMLIEAVEPSAPQPAWRGLALVDPAYHGRRWLRASRIDGRRSALPYVDYAAAARRHG